MKLCDINPHLRFAAHTSYCSSTPRPTKVTDCRIFYVHSGQCEIFIENEHYSMTKNSLFYCCGGSEYSILAPDTLSIFSLNFDLTQEHNYQSFPFSPIPIREIKDTTPFYHDELEDSPILNSHFLLNDGSAFFARINRILSEFANQGVFYRELCSGILKELLIELHRSQTTNSSRISYLLSYIDTNYADELCNRDLAALVGYHEYHLNRLFLSCTGTTIHNYILRVRLNHARHLILNTDISLNLIAEKVGFNSYSHFSSYFRQHFGMSPSEYRKQLKNSL